MSEPTPDEVESMSDLDMMTELLAAFDVEYTIIHDEAGTTIEVVGGDRGTRGFSGLAVTYNFAPPSDDEKRNETFLFLGVARA
jgi:hypothetical protein